jgi:PhnB protein
MERPQETEYASFYAGYVALVPETGILAVLEEQVDEVLALAAHVPPEREGHRYAEGKWSLRQVMGHLVDAERVFGYRAFCFSRGERAALASFDENAYVAEAPSEGVPLRDLAQEFALVRRSNLAFLRRLRPAEWGRTGTASGHPVTVRALAWIMAGHPRHHLTILRERYGVAGGSMAVHPIPDGYHTLTPYLIVRGAAAALDFYARALGATELYRMADATGKVGHAEMQVGDSRFMLADEFPERGAVSPLGREGHAVSFLLYVEDIDAAFARAVATGARVVRPVENQFYGDRSGTLVDPFGHQWTLATHVEDVAPEEMTRRMEAAKKKDGDA